jgi:transcriptional regulator with XRE-family HTH domain
MSRHPIDATIRERLRGLNLKQKDLAAAIGRSPGWVSKYLSGVGHATIDDLIRIVAVVQEFQVLSEHERRLLKACRRIPADSQDDAVTFFEDWARREVRAARKRGSAARSR